MIDTPAPHVEHSETVVSTDGSKPSVRPDESQPAQSSAPTDTDKTVVVDTRTAAEIEADLAATRDRLTLTLDELQARLAPSAIASRGKAKLKGIVVDEHGGIRVERVAAAGAVVVGLLVVRGLFRRARR